MIRFSKIIAVILVLLALVLCAYAWMLSRKPAPAVVAPPSVAKVAPAEATFPIVVATQPLPAGQAIEASALRVAQLTINPGGAFMSVSEVVGRVPVFDLGTGSPLLENQLVSGLSMRLEAGERAVAVKADEVMGVGNSVRPGDFVDVFFALKADGRDVERSQSRLLLARTRVLAYGSASVDGMPTHGEGRASQKPQAGSGQPARTAVLAVAVEDVNRLALGEAHGRLLLALRHPNDTAEPDPTLFAELQAALQPQAGKRGTAPLSGVDRAVAGLTTQDLASGGSTARSRANFTPSAQARPVRTAAPASGHEVEIFRGDRRDTVRY
ncbi:Flp pilus assembly protein CpaB [Hydrogenophaga sp. BPS33]|uniref:Flp pilus assembly protein CpaB n=1 Tax=Hydrogenophaga sp. BPS33 TaxID=2651974 RepID=UPI00131F5E06|nr:Flp pilus assembly protein CpaB [Hydrogenophaga sp. BPS33]QHE86446.1 Flp pilus assembly protein CpaB [Hydrogenophaga sp. BPS33]